MIKLIISTVLSLAVVAIICFPLFVVWMGVFAPLSFWGHVAVTSIGLILCYVVKPVSIFTGMNHQIF